jgi:hypothetical protein
VNKYGWSSWGWYEPSGSGIDENAEPLRRWKWHGRQDVFVETNNDPVLLFLAGALEQEGL